MITKYREEGIFCLFYTFFLTPFVFILLSLSPNSFMVSSHSEIISASNQIFERQPRPRICLKKKDVCGGSNNKMGRGGPTKMLSAPLSTPAEKNICATISIGQEISVSRMQDFYKTCESKTDSKIVKPRDRVKQKTLLGKE